MIEVKNIYKQVNTAEGVLRILEDINLSVARSETLAIVGPQDRESPPCLEFSLVLMFQVRDLYRLMDMK